jgi:hypothetical protein
MSERAFRPVMMYRSITNTLHATATDAAECTCHRLMRELMEKDGATDFSALRGSIIANRHEWTKLLAHIDEIMTAANNVDSKGGSHE